MDNTNTTNSLIQQLQQQNQTSAANDLTIPGNASSLISQAQSALNAGNSNNGSAAGAPVTTNNTGGGLLGTLARWAPTIGSVALPAIADIATGGLAAPLDVALAAAGGAGGRMAENAASGQKVLSGNDITAGLEAGVGQGIGKVLNAGLGAAGGALTKFGAKAAEQTETSTATQAALDEQSRIADEFGAVKPGAASVGDALTTARGLGLENPTAQDLDSISKIYTHGDINTNGGGVLNTYKNQVLQQAGGTVDLGDVVPNLKTTLTSGKNPLLLGDMEPTTVGRGGLPVAPNNVATNMVSQLRAMIPGEEVEGTGTEGEFTKLGSQVAPKDGQTILKAVGDKMNETTPMPNSVGVLDKADIAENNAWRTVYRNVRQSLYNRPEVNDLLKNTTVTPEMSSQIDDVIKAYGSDLPVEVQGNIKQDLIDTINNGSKMDDILDKESPMVNTGQVGKIQTEAEANNPQTTKANKAIKSQINQGKGGLNNMFTPRNIMEGGGILEAVKGHPAIGIPLMIAGNPAAAGATGGLLSKLATGRIGQTVAPAITTALATSPNTVQGGNIVNPSQSGNIQAGSSVLDQALQEAMENPLNGGLSQISALLPMVQKVNAAQAAEQNIAQYFNAAGGAQGPVGGIINKLLSGFGTGGAAAQYGAQAQALEQQLQAAGINAPAPQITQNKTAAQAAINNIQNLIQSLQLGNQSGVLTQ